MMIIIHDDDDDDDDDDGGGGGGGGGEYGGKVQCITFAYLRISLRWLQYVLQTGKLSNDFIIHPYLHFSPLLVN